MAERPEVTVQDNTERQRFEAIVGDQVAGYISYEVDGDAIDMQHTVVGDEWEGQGIGSALARGALDQSRDAGRRVIPTCSFVKGYTDKHEEYADLVG
jgi:hypothetical protein